MESYHHRPLWDRSFKSPKKKSKKKLPLHVGSWKVEKTFKLFLLKLPRWIFQNVSQDLKFSPKVGRVWNTSKSCTWEANLVKIYQSIFNRYIYIYTGSIQNRSKSLRFQNSTPFSPTKDFRNGWTFIYEKTNTAMGLRHDRGWVTVMAPSSAISPKCSNSMKCTIAEIALAVNGW